MKTKTILIIIITVLLISAIVWFILWRRRQATPEPVLVPGPPPPTPSKTGGNRPKTEVELNMLYASLPQGTWPIKRGSRDKHVFVLQKMLLEMYPGQTGFTEPDGVFGPLTEAITVVKLGVSQVSQQRYAQFTVQYQAFVASKTKGV